MKNKTNYTIDENRIISAIMEAKVNSPLAREAGAELVDAWIREKGLKDAERHRILAVECGFFIALEPKTFIVGVQDLITDDGVGSLGNEWKSTKEPTKYWTEEKWLSEIKRGPQLSIYGLALNRGIFFPKKENKGIVIAAEFPRIRVRAAVKSSPVDFYPYDETEGIIEFTEKQLDITVAALMNKAATIRQLRKAVKLPWQLRGKQCFNFNRECEFLGDICSKFNYPHGTSLNSNTFDKSDPAAELVLPNLPDVDINDPEVVILSASSYETASECLEKYRIISSNCFPKEENLAMDTGTVMHSGLASFYQQIKEQQDKRETEKNDGGRNSQET